MVNDKCGNEVGRSDLLRSAGNGSINICTL